MTRWKGDMDCSALRTSVLRWFGSELECHSSGDESLVVTFPILRLNGDAIEIGISPSDGGRWRLSDLGDTHSTFFLADLDFQSEYVRAEEFNQIIAAHGLNDAGEEILADVSDGELVDRVFDFLHALQSMSALQFTAKPRLERRDFHTIVAKFFAEQRASFDIPPEPIEGRSGKWNFDFSLNHVATETLVKTISTVARNQVVSQSEKATFEIMDVRRVRDAGAIVIGDDYGKERESIWRPDVVRIFRENDVPFYAFQSDNDSLVVLAQKYAARET